MKDLLTILQSELTRIHSPITMLWNNGANDKEINQVREELGFPLHADAIALFTWKNGIRHNENLPMGSHWLFPLAMPVTLERAIETYKYYSVHDEDYREKLFLLFESGGGIMFLIDCDERSTQYGMILIHDIGALESGREVLTTVYDSLSTCLATIIRCYQENVYSFSGVEEKVLLASDYARKCAIAATLNPAADFWKDY